MAETPVAMLWAGRVWTVEAFARRVHPGDPNPLPAELHTAVRLLPTPCRPVGHDGVTIDRYPAVELGHMKES